MNTKMNASVVKKGFGYLVANNRGQRQTKSNEQSDSNIKQQKQQKQKQRQQQHIHEFQFTCNGLRAAVVDELINVILQI